MGRLHWLIFWPSAFWLLVAIAIACVGAFVAVEDPQRQYCFYAAAAIAFVALVMMMSRNGCAGAAPRSSSPIAA